MTNWTPIVTKMPSPGEVLAQPERPEVTPEQEEIYIISIWLAYPWTALVQTGIDPLSPRRVASSDRGP